MSTEIDVSKGEPDEEQGPIKQLDEGNPRRIFWVGGFDFWFDIALLLFWLVTRGSDYGSWRLENCGDGSAGILNMLAAAQSINKTWFDTSEGLWFGLAGTVILKELLAIWVAIGVLKEPYRSNLCVQSATSVLGAFTEAVATLTQTTGDGDASLDDPDNPQVLADINDVGCCCGNTPLRSWWMTTCLLENTFALVFAMHCVGGCLVKTPQGVVIVIGSLLTTILALVTRTLRITGKRAKMVMPGIRRQSSLFGATEHDVLEEYTDCAVLTSDLSGFTKTTKQYGIVFMASIIQRMRQISLPIAYSEKPHSVGFEADDLIIVFRDVDSAFRAAAIINYLVIKNREDAPEGEVHFTPKLGGIGIHSGPKILKRRNGQLLYGATAAEAYHLGEEMAEKEFIISEAVYQQLRPEVQKLFKEKVYSVGSRGTRGA